MEFKKIEMPRGIPESLIIVESGWKDHYHIIHECPEDGDLDYTHFFGNKEDILKSMRKLGFADKEKTEKLLFGDLCKLCVAKKI